MKNRLYPIGYFIKGSWHCIWITSTLNVTRHRGCTVVSSVAWIWTFITFLCLWATVHALTICMVEFKQCWQSYTMCYYQTGQCVSSDLWSSQQLSNVYVLKLCSAPAIALLYSTDCACNRTRLWTLMYLNPFYTVTSLQRRWCYLVNIWSLGRELIFRKKRKQMYIHKVIWNINSDFNKTRRRRNNAWSHTHSGFSQVVHFSTNK